MEFLAWLVIALMPFIELQRGVASSAPTAAPITRCGPHTHYLNGQFCCSQCAPGHGVLNPCSPGNNTRCRQCVYGESYSPEYSHLATCKPCSLCPPYSHATQLCNTTHDTVCECDTNYYFDDVSRKCRSCDLCRIGHGVRRACNSTHNTMCMACRDGTFSDRPSAAPCQFCSLCEQNQVMLQYCTTLQDSVCIEIPQFPSTPQLFFVTDRIRPTSEEHAGDVPTSTERDVIPIYCAILGAVVLALVIYVIVSQCRRRKLQKAAKANAATPAELPPLLNQSMMSSPGSAATKQGSDSGVYMDQEMRQVTGGTRVRDLPAVRRKALENSLHAGLQGPDDWKLLARELAISPPYLASIEARAMQDGSSPVRLLLFEWSQAEGATIMRLTQALRNIRREDCVRILYGDNRDYIITPQYLNSSVSSQQIV